jgi:hypothetical protein
LVLLVVAAALLATAATQANDRVARLGKLLRSSDDFRVRTQAALALGASKDKDAVDHLCVGLSDRSASVRAASAAALGRLRKGGADCLRDRLPKEKEKGSVWSVIKRALASVESAEAEAGPAEIPAGAKYYVAIEVSDKSGRKVIAPAGETSDQAKQVMADHPALKGFLLSTKAKPPQYEAGSLKIRLEIAIFTYPGRALKGMYPQGLTQPGVSSPSEKYENELYEMAAERAMQKFASQAGRIQ